MKQFTACVCEPCYPEHFPSLALTNILGYLRGGEGAPDMACAAHCGWVVQGFAMSFIPHEHPPLIGDDGCPKELSDEELATKIEGCCAPQNAEADSSWIIILLPLVTEFLRRLLERRRPNPA